MFKFPYTNLHELNLDWILEKVKTLVANNDEFNEKADYAVETADEAKTIAEQAAQAQIGDGAVTTSKLADGAVTSAKLANNAVYSVNIVDGEVDTSDLAEGAVTTSRILDSAVTGAKIFDGAVTTNKIGNGAVTNGKIEDGAVNTAKISDSAVTPAKLSNDVLNMFKGTLVQHGGAFTSTTTRSYTGYHITIPAHSTFIIEASLWYLASSPVDVTINTSDTNANATTASGGNHGSIATATYIGITDDTPIEFYLWASYSAVGSNQGNIKAIYW